MIYPSLATPQIDRPALDKLQGAWFVMDSAGTICHTTRVAQHWLKNKLTPTEQIRVRAFASQLAVSQDNCGLLPLDYRSIRAEVTPAFWDENNRVISLYPSQLDVSQAEYLGKTIGLFAQTFREPATKLGLFANLLTRGRVENQDFYEEVLFREIGRINRLIENLSLLSQLMEPETISPSHFTVGQLAGSIRNSLEPHKLESELHISCDPCPDKKVVVNPRLIGHAVSDLISYLPPANPDDHEIRIRVKPIGSWVGVVIESPLFAIPEDGLFQLFEPFAQGVVDLELTVVRSIIGNHHGHLTARSKGNSMSLTLCLPIPIEWDVA